MVSGKGILLSILVSFSNVHLISYVTGSRYFSWEILVQQGFRQGLRQGDSCQGKRLWYLESVCIVCLMYASTLYTKPI
jgi:hypothetical protein